MWLTFFMKHHISRLLPLLSCDAGETAFATANAGARLRGSWPRRARTQLAGGWRL